MSKQAYPIAPGTGCVCWRLILSIIILLSIRNSVWGITAYGIISDVIHGPDGKLFSGTLVIVPVGFESSTVPPTVSVPVVNGLFSLRLLPNFRSLAGGKPTSYFVTYASSDKQSWTEQWTVPEGRLQLALADIRSVEGSKKALQDPVLLGADELDSKAVTSVSLPIPITDVTGLSAQLSSINNSLAALSSALTGVQGSVNTLAQTSSSPSTQIRGEILNGVSNGTNSNFSVASLPIAGSLVLYRNGMRLSLNVDYTISGTSITFINNILPLRTDVLVADYLKGIT